jgi:glucose-1-phosphate thymidylyltransferase
LAQGVLIAERFTENENFWFILGDNLFHGPDFGLHLSEISVNQTGAHIFAYRVSDPSQYGVIQFSETDESIIQLVEKPPKFISHWAIPGLYFFDNSAAARASKIAPSKRGELEIIDLIESYRISDELAAHKVSRGNAWFDLGTPDSLLTGGQFVQLIQSRQGLLVGSPEEASFRKGFIKQQMLLDRFSSAPNNFYGNSIINILADHD